MCGESSHLDWNLFRLLRDIVYWKVCKSHLHTVGRHPSCPSPATGVRTLVSSPLRTPFFRVNLTINNRHQWLLLPRSCTVHATSRPRSLPQGRPTTHIRRIREYCGWRNRWPHDHGPQRNQGDRSQSHYFERLEQFERRGVRQRVLRGRLPTRVAIPASRRRHSPRRRRYYSLRTEIRKAYDHCSLLWRVSRNIKPPGLHCY